MDYVTLRSRVESAMGRTDVPSYVYALATADINRDLRVLEMESSATISADAETGTLPTDFLQVRSIYVDRTPRKVLVPITSQSMNVRHDSSGLPAFYAIEDGQIRFMPIPDATYSIEMRYVASLSDLSDDADTNTIMSTFPGLYIYASLRHSSVWAQDSEMMGVYQAAYSNELASCATSDKKKRNAGPTTLRPAIGSF